MFLEKITQEILRVFSLQKYDLGEFINMLIHDMNNLNDQVITKKVSIINKKLESASTSMPFDFLKIDTVDPFFQTIISGTFDYILQQRRNYLKSIKITEIHRIIETILNSL